MAHAKCETCDEPAAWWMTGFAVNPHPRCSSCKSILELQRNGSVYAQPLSAFDEMPTVVEGKMEAVGTATVSRRLME